MFVEPAEVLARWAYSDIAGTRAAAYDAVMPLFWLVHEVDGKRGVFRQEAGD